MLRPNIMHTYALRELSRFFAFFYGSRLGLGRFLTTASVLLVALGLSALVAQAKIGAAHQLLLGNPSTATSDAANKDNYLIVRDQYAMSYNNANGQANWVSWNLTSSDIGGSGRSDNFYPDTTLPFGFYVVQEWDYQNSGYQRGHMCPSGDRTISRADNDVTFYMSNMVPQTSANNTGVWNNFETYCRTLATQGYEVLIIAGPSFFGGSRLPSNAAAIPGYTWKIAVVVPPGTGTAAERINTSTRVIAIRVPNTSSVSSTWQTYLTSVSQLQQDTGFTFFTALPENVASVLRATVDGQPITGIPNITTNPVSQTATVGGTATFSVSATGDAPITYQWYFEGEEIADATGPTLVLSGVDIFDMGQYHATASNSVGIITSSPATLTVTGAAPLIVSSPVSQTVNAGSNLVLNVVAAGSPAISYQWRRNGAPVSGAIYATLALNNVQAADAGNYDVVVTNSVGTATSGVAALTVMPVAPTITTQPVSRSVGPNGTTNFTVVAVGTQPMTYQWRKGGAPVTNNVSATAATLVLTGVTEATAGSYDVVVTNSAGSITSSAATLTVSAFADGAINLTGGTYSQNFNTLISAAGTDLVLNGVGPHALDLAPLNASAMQGWTLAKYSGGGASALFKVDVVSEFVSGAVYSFGALNNTERALGSIGSGSTVSRFGVTFVNSTGQTLTEFDLSYMGEQWRRGDGNANKLTFAYAIGATDINTGTFVDVPELSFVAPVAAGSAAWLDGNATGNRVGISGKVSNIIWPAGAKLVLRWSDANETGGDDGLAIDDLSFTVAQQSGPVAPEVVITSPANGATEVSTGAAVNITFNQPVNLAAGWFIISSAKNGPMAATVTGGPNAYVLTTPVLFEVDDAITVTIVASKVTDQATGTLTMTENHVFAFDTAAPQPPVILTSPASQSVSANNNVTFVVNVGGSAPFSYQWRKNGAPIDNNATATSSSLSLFNVQAIDSGEYDVVVSNTSGTVTSQIATLTVTAALNNVVRWNFSAVTPSSGMPLGMTGGTMTQGNSNGSTALLSTASISSGYLGSSGNANAAIAARVGAYNPAANGSAYFQFTLTPPNAQRLVATGIAFGSRSSGTGPQAYALYSSVDGYTDPIASGTMSNDSTWVLHTAEMPSVTGAFGGPVTFRLYGFNGIGTPSSGTANWRIDDLALTLVLEDEPPPPSGFGTWLAEHFTEQERNDPQISGPDAKLTPDGLTNLMKYALGFAPRGPVGALPEPATADNDWTYTYTRPSERPDLTYTVQVSTDLVSWNSDGVEHVQVATGDGVETWRARHAGGAKLFFRLKVERP